MKQFVQLTAMAALVMATSTARSNARAAEADSLPGIHEGRYRLPRVTQVVFSPDSRHVVAAYYRPAMNRAGTDWGAFVAQWDLKTGKRVIIPSGIAPLAFNPDGKSIAMGVYERSREPGKRYRPQMQLALWSLGAKKPKATFVRGGEADSTVVAAAFHPGGKHVVSLNESGQLLLWEVNKRSEPIVLDTLDANLQRYGWGSRRATLPLTFSKDGRQLVLIVSLHSRPPLQGRRITWQIDLEKRKATRVEEKKIDPTGARHVRPQEVGRFDGLPPTTPSPDGKLKAAARPDGTIRLIGKVGDDERTVRVLRLDDKPGGDEKR